MIVSVSAIQRAAELANQCLQEFRERTAVLDLPRREYPLFAHSLLGASILEVMVKTLGHEGTLRWVHAVLGSLAKNAAALDSAKGLDVSVVEIADSGEKPS